MRYQIFFTLPENLLSNGVADVSAEYLEDFCKDKIILKIIPYPIDNPPY